MKASDLAVGDWVMPLRKCIGKPCQVVSIDGGTNTCWIDSDEYSGLLPCSELERIPLTPEILEKNGFKKSESETLSHTLAWAEKSEKIYNRWVQITLYNEPINGVSYLTKIETCSSKGDGVNHLHSCDIESVHELQHALRLCEINLEITV